MTTLIRHDLPVDRYFWLVYIIDLTTFTPVVAVPGQMCLDSDW